VFTVAFGGRVKAQPFFFLHCFEVFARFRHPFPFAYYSLEIRLLFPHLRKGSAITPPPFFPSGQVQKGMHLSRTILAGCSSHPRPAIFFLPAGHVALFFDYGSSGRGRPFSFVLCPIAIQQMLGSAATFFLFASALQPVLT